VIDDAGIDLAPTHHRYAYTQAGVDSDFFFELPPGRCRVRNAAASGGTVERVVDVVAGERVTVEM